MIPLFFALLFVLAGCSKGQEQDASALQEDAKEQTINANTVDQSNMDIVFVMDKSGSMVKSDKDRIAVMGAQMFLDMIPRTGANAGVVDFASSADAADMTQIQDDDKGKTYLKNYLANIEYDSGVTDYGLALKKAVELLDQSDSNNQKAILFFTDGNLNTGKKRDISEAESDVEEAVAAASKKGYRIFSLGLNNNEKVDEVVLSKFAKDTDGNYWVVDSASELLKAFENIFKEIGSTEEKVIGTIQGSGSLSFNVDSANVSEANLVILSSSKLKDIKLRDPDKKLVNLEGERCVASIKEKYTVLKIINPDKGRWKLSVKGVRSDNIIVKLIYDYDLSIDANVTVDKLQTGGVMSITSLLRDQDKEIVDKAFYKKRKATASISYTASNGEVSSEPIISMKAGKNGYQGTYTIPAAGDYEIRVKIEDKNNWHRESQIMRVTIEPSQIIQKKKLEKVSVDKGSERQIDLSDYFEDSQGSKLSYNITAVDTDQAGIEETVKGSVMTVKADRAGSEKVNLTVTNSEGTQMPVSVKVVGETFFSKYGVICLVILLVLIMIAVLIVSSYLSKKMVGEMQVTMFSRKKEEGAGVPKETSYQLYNEAFRCRKIGEHGFTAAQLLSAFTNLYISGELDDGKKGEYLALTEKAKGVFKNVSLKPTSKKACFVVKSKDKNAILLDAFRANTGKEQTIQMKSGETVTFGIKVKLDGGVDQNGCDVIMMIGAVRD